MKLSNHQIIKVFRILIVFLLVFYSCSSKDEIPKEIELNNINIDLPIDFNFVKGVYFKTSNLNSFSSKFSKDFFSDMSFNMLISNDITTVAFSTNVNENNTKTTSKSSDSKTCETCRDDKCVEKVIKDAFANYNPKTNPIYITSKPVKTLGVVTGVEICYSNKPIEEVEVYFLNIDDKDSSEDVLAIDHLLED